LADLVSSQDGCLGSSIAPLGVFHDFFIDEDLLLMISVRDEILVVVRGFNLLVEP
jgi:hypothetical protein